MDVDVVLPRAVAAEVARAASVAWLAGRADPVDAPLSRPHDEFLERYGPERAVPLRELMDPYAGLGPPPAPGRRQSAGTDRDPRGDVLLELATAAIAAGSTEIELNERTVAALAGPGPVPVPPAVDLPVQLLARSVDAVARGEYRLVVSSPRVAGPAGATSGRFAGLLSGTTERLARLAADLDGAVPVEVAFPPAVDRAANLMLAPRTGRYEISVGTFPRDVPLQLGDLEVYSDGRRLRLSHAGLGQELRPVAHHLVDLTTQAPAEARFLLELGRSGAWRPWSWGPAGFLPALPAVRTGRTVLAPATWRPGSDLLDDTCSTAEWERRFGRWRDMYSVPALVDAGTGDERIELDLTARAHRELFRALLRRERHTNLTALPDLRFAGEGSPDDPDGWLEGRRGELVVTLLPAAPVPRPASPPRRRSRPGAEEDWLFVAVRCTPEHELEILLDHLPALIRAMPATVDRWFFVRYRHPHTHLRLRFHVAAPDRRGLSRHVLPMVHDWASTLRTLRLAGPMTVHDYDPEVERYGGPRAMAAAERLFCADSTAALELLPALTAGRVGVHRAVVLAANHVDLLSGLRDPAGAADESAWASWLEWPGLPDAGRRGQEALTRAAFAAIDPYAVRQQVRAGLGRTVAEAWHRRAPAVAAYGRELHRSAGGAAEVARRAVLHMSANRLLGPDRNLEAVSYALARTAVRARTGRRRHTGTGRPADARRAGPEPHQTKDGPHG